MARLVVVTGGKGGPGATTLAVGLAGAWAAAGRPVLLADVDPAGGDVAAHLPVGEVRRGVGPLLGLAGGRLDAGAVWAETVEAGPFLRVLAGLPRPDSAGLLAAPTAVSLLTAARRLERVEVLVVDAGRLLPGTAAAGVLGVAEVGVLAVRAELPGALAAQRALDAAPAGIGLALVAVAVPRRRSGDVAELAEALGRPVAGVLPADPHGVRRAVERGWPPVRGRLGRGYAALAARLDPGPAAGGAEAGGRTGRGRLGRRSRRSAEGKEEAATA